MLQPPFIDWGGSYVVKPCSESAVLYFSCNLFLSSHDWIW